MMMCSELQAKLAEVDGNDLPFSNGKVTNLGEETKSFQELTQIYLRPAVLGMARAIDQILTGQAVRFRKYCVGGLGTMSPTNAGNYLVDARTRMNRNKVIDDMNRHLILTPYSEGILLKNTQFTDANRVGDDGTALREASLGRKFGFNVFMGQNTPYVAVGNTSTLGAINHSGGYLAGATTFVVNGFSAAITAGSWIQIAGDDTPLQVVSTVGGATPTSITVLLPITSAVASGAVVTAYSTGTVNFSAGYAAGYAKHILVTGCTPQTGQPVTFSADNSDVYTVIDTDGSTYVVLDRPLVATIANGDAVALGPPGSYNFGFHRTAIAFVNRPLALPRAGMGALASNVNFNNLSLRVVMTYDGDLQGTRVTVDMLAGVAQLEPLNGVLLLA